MHANNFLIRESVQKQREIPLASSSVSNSSDGISSVESWHKSKRYSLVQALGNPVKNIQDWIRWSGDEDFSDFLNQDNYFKRSTLTCEILQCEKDYTSLLQILVKEYLRTSEKSELFDKNLICAVFGNIEEICGIHEKILVDLNVSLRSRPMKIGHVFLDHALQLKSYTKYFINYRRSSKTLNKLYGQQRYLEFFGKIRNTDKLPALPLSSFLLRPIQHICRYPVLLTDLASKTPQCHDDFGDLTKAVKILKTLLNEINAECELFDHMVQLVKWQKSVVGWLGGDILESSQKLLNSSQMSYYKVHTNQSQKSSPRKECILFLFDSVTIMCKKDKKLKKSSLLFKRRLLTRNVQLEYYNKDRCEFVISAPPDQTFIFECEGQDRVKSWVEAIEMAQNHCECQPTGWNLKKLVQETAVR